MSKKIKFLVGGLLLLILAAAAFYFGYWIRTPQYSLQLIQKSVQEHDEASFEKHVDLDHLFSKLFDDCIASEFHMQSSVPNSFLQSQVLSIKSSVVPVFSSMAKSLVKTGAIDGALNASSEGTGRSSQLAEGMAAKMGLPYLIYKSIGEVTKTSDNEAVVTMNIHDTQTDKDLPVRLLMSRLEDGTWKITEIANVAEYFNARQKAIADKLAEINQPIKAKIDAAVQVITSGEKAPKLNLTIVAAGVPIGVVGGDFSVRNVGKKDILSVSGTVQLQDAQEKSYYQNGFEVSAVAAGQTVTVHNTWALNPFLPDHHHLMDIKLKDIKPIFEVNNVIFKDHSTLSLIDRLPQKAETVPAARAKGAAVK